MRLGVNVDHVATLREVRGGSEPEPLSAALICLTAGADSIVVHLREDRRHIKEKDLYLLKKAIKKKLNLEMSLAADIVRIACKVRPDQATIVPERRQEITTEGGLDVVSNFRRVKLASEKLKERGIAVSLFIDPEKKQIDAADRAGVKMIELHTGRFCSAKNKIGQDRFLRELKTATGYARKKGFDVFAGHGLDYHNVSRVAGIKGIEELNIGYSIVCRAVLVGLYRAVKEIRQLIKS